MYRGHPDSADVEGRNRFAIPAPAFELTGQSMLTSVGGELLCRVTPVSSVPDPLGADCLRLSFSVLDLPAGDGASCSCRSLDCPHGDWGVVPVSRSLDWPLEMGRRGPASGAACKP